MSNASAPAVAAAAKRATFHDVLAIREYRALYVAQTLSVAGDQFARIAVAWLVFGRTNSPFLTGLTYAVTYLPWIIGGPVLSVYADRLPRRTVMISCDLARTALVLVLAIPRLPTAVLIAFATATACFEPAFSSARASTIPEVVGDGPMYAAASNLGNTTSQLAGVLGFAVGGGLVTALGARPTLTLDSLTFAISAFVATKYLRHRPAAITERSSWLAEISAGARVVFTDHRLRWLVITSWLVMGAIVSTEAVAIPYARFHGHGAPTAGLLTAALPLGLAFGAWAVGRFTSFTLAERLMLPMAIACPTVVAFTAFDPVPLVAAGVWFLAGVFGSMTFIANRVVVISVPREVRGRAFGVAGAGIAGSLGVSTLVSGALASHVGPAHAVADVALPALALIVVLSATSASFSPRPSAPIPVKSQTEDEEPPVPAPSRRPEPQVWALSAALAIIAVALAPLLRGDHASSNINLPVAWVAFLFLLGIVYPLRFKYRQQTWTVSLETVPLVLALLFVTPLTLLFVRVGVISFYFLIVRRLPLLRSAFNIASQTCNILVTIAVFRLIAPAHAHAHPAVWPAVFASILASEVTSAILVTLVISVSDRSWNPRSAVRTVGVGAAVSVVMAFLALAMAASLSYDLATGWAITVFVVLTVGGIQTYHRVADRAGALDRLVIVARELSPTASGASDLAPALTQLRRVIKADSLRVSVPIGGSFDFESVVRAYDDPKMGETTEIYEQAVTSGPHNRPNASINSWRVLLPMRMRRSAQHEIAAPLRAGDRSLGTLVASSRVGDPKPFERADLRLLEAAADQLAAALEKGRLVESLRRAATLDTLTGLANLESLRTFLDSTFDGSVGGTLILLNLDRFHEVNDMLGHDAGDAVLAEVARRLQSSPTNGALVARVGGDQFAIAIPGSAGTEVARLAAMAVKSRVDGSIRFAEVSADVRATVGLARAPEHGSDAVTLLRRAEMAMTAAKGGSSGIGEWEPAYERDGSRRLQLLSGLRVALGDGSLRVEYQPKLTLSNGDVTGFEALVRWTHPELGPVSPAEFVPLAEATGLISALTSIVLRQALTTCRSWHDAGKPVGVAVNVSARSLDDNVLVGQVAAMLTASGLEPRWLTLEITESSVMEDHDRSVEVLRELRMLGVRLSIDDFGTGYSSLHQLRGLPVHEVKIDRSFIETVDSDQADRAVVRAVVELCDSLGLVTVAEGVEKATQAYALESLGVVQVQGYFHGRPMTEQAAMEWLLPRQATSYAKM